ncbi:hypothetical protein MANES_02G181350v8 [Manihot esculenta]|uniref:Uncharacterized protein n=1 Tax=Manihot esculenta TaxID=3983 RepID=A0ACB7I8H9_MANES|nr:hypothetical protein MANES_02G181350v8 [Manihot esculenta]
MDFYSLKRKQLQALCKKHGIPANTTNLEMAERLTASLKVNGIATSEEGNEKNSKDAPKKLKKVRFRPDNETREYVPSAYRKPEGRRRRATLVNPVSKELGQSNLSENVVRKKRERGSEKIESDCRITRSRARVDNETFSVLQKSRASQEGEASKNIARDSVEARKGFRRSKRNMAKCTDSEIMKVDVVSRITRSGAQFAGNSSTVGGKGENEVFGVAKECEGAVRIKKLSEGLSRNGSRRKSVAQHNDEVESYGQEVLKEARKKSMNLNFANVNEVNASLASTERTEKVSITAAGQRRSRRKAAVVNSTAAIDEHGIGESIGKVKKSNENVLREDAKVSNELRRSTRNASRQCSVANFNKMNEIADSVGNIGQLKRKREAIKETEATLDGSLVGEPPRRSALEALKSGLVGLSAACKSVEEKATENMKNANDITISQLSEVDGLTTGESGFKTFEKRKVSKSKARGKTCIATVGVSALHSATKFEKNLASTPVLLASAATEQASSIENVSGKDAEVSNKLQSSTGNASRQILVPTFNEMNEIADSNGKVGQLKRKRDAVKGTKAYLDGSLDGEPPSGSTQVSESGFVGLSEPCISVEEKATEHIENANCINISPSEDNGLTVPEAAFKSFEKRGESKIKTRGKRSIATLDVSTLYSGTGEEIDSATSLEENLASTPLVLTSSYTEEASLVVGNSQAINANNVVLVNDIGKLVSDTKGGVDDQSCQSLEIYANLASDNSTELELAKFQEKACDVASPSGGFSSANQFALAGESCNLSGLEKGLAREQMSTDKDACAVSDGISNNSIEVDGISVQKDGVCGLEGTEQDGIKDEIKHNVVPSNREWLPAVSAEIVTKSTNNVCLESNKTVTPNSDCGDGKNGVCGLQGTEQDGIKDEIKHNVVPYNRRWLPAVSTEIVTKSTNNVCLESNKTIMPNSDCGDGKNALVRMVPYALPQFYFENLEDRNMSNTAMLKNSNDEVLRKHEAVRETEASLDGSLVREPPRRSTLEALESDSVGLSTPCKSVEGKETKHIKNPLSEENGLTMPEVAFKSFEKEGESKFKTRGKRSKPAEDVFALRSGIGEERDNASKLRKNLASTPLLLASAATDVEASKAVRKPEAINDNNVIMAHDLGKLFSNTKGGIDDQSCQSVPLEIWASLDNHNSTALKLVKTIACDVTSPYVGFSSSNQYAFKGERSKTSGLKKGLAREQMSTSKDACYDSDGVSGNSTEVDRIAIQEDGVSGLERTEQDDIRDGTGRSLPAVRAEIATKSIKNVYQESNETVTPNSNCEDAKSILERMVPDALPKLYFENLEEGNMSNPATTKNFNDEVLREQNFGDCMAGKGASFDSNGGKPFFSEAPSTLDVLKLPSNEFRHYEEMVIESNCGVDAVTDVPMTKYWDAVINMVGNQSMDGEPKPEVEQHDKKSKDSEDLVNGKFVEEPLNAAQCDQVVREGNVEGAWVDKLSDNGDGEEVPTKVNDNFSESLTKSIFREREYFGGENVSQFPECITGVDGMEKKEVKCKVSDSIVDTTVTINGYHMDDEAADVHDIIYENAEINASETCMMTIEMQEAPSGGILQKNETMEPGKEILDCEDELLKVNDAGAIALSEVASTDFGGLDKRPDGATVKAVELENLEEKCGSELDISDHIAFGIDVKAAEANEKVENMDGNLKGKDFNSEAEQESDNIVFSSHETASLNIQVESAIVTNWEVNLIQGNGEQNREIISDEDLLDNNSMIKDSGHVMHAEEAQVEKSEEVTEDSLVNEDSGHTVLIKDVTNIQKLAQFAEMHFSEALPSVRKEPTVDLGLDQASFINQEIIDIQNCEDEKVENFSISAQEEVWAEEATVSGKGDDLVKCNANRAPENNISYSGSEGDTENRACAEDEEVCTPTTGKIDIPKEVAVGETVLSDCPDKKSHEMARSELQTIISNCSNWEDYQPAENLLFADTCFGKPEFASGSSFTQQNAIAEASSEEFKEQVKEKDDTIIGEYGTAQRSGRDLNDPIDGSSLGNRSSCPQEVAKDQLNVPHDSVNESDFMNDVDYATLNKRSCENESKIHSSEAGEARHLHKLDDEVPSVVEPKTTVDFENLVALPAFKSELLINCSTISAVCSSPYHESEALVMTSEVAEESKVQDNMPAKTDDTQGSIVYAKATAFCDAATMEQTLKSDPCNLKPDNIGNLNVEDVGEAKESTKDMPKMGEALDKSPGFTTSGVGQDITAVDGHGLQRKLQVPLKPSSHPEKEDELNVYGVRLMMTRKSNIISLIQGTPQKALDANVMKENAPSTKRQRVGEVTAPKTLPKRRPLEDLKKQ